MSRPNCNDQRSTFLTLSWESWAKGVAFCAATSNQPQLRDQAVWPKWVHHEQCKSSHPYGFDEPLWSGCTASLWLAALLTICTHKHLNTRKVSMFVTQLLVEGQTVYACEDIARQPWLTSKHLICWDVCTSWLAYRNMYDLEFVKEAALLCQMLGRPIQRLETTIRQPSKTAFWYNSSLAFRSCFTWYLFQRSCTILDCASAE